MSIYNLRFLILLIIALIGLKNEMLSQESGWEQKGNLKYQIAAIDTIVQHGISVSGDTLWTFCKDSTLYYWDIETGNLINKKKFDDIYRISVDLNSYIYLKQTSAYNIVRYMLRVYNLSNDTLICEDEIVNLDVTSAMIKTTVYVYGYDYDIHTNKFYFSANRSYTWSREWGNSIISYIYKLEKDTAKQIDNKVGLGQSFSFSNDLKKITFTGYSEHNSTMYSSYHNAVVAYHQKGDTETKVIISYKISSDNPNTKFLKFSNAQFLNSQDKIAAISYPDIYVWNINTKKELSKFKVVNQNPGIYDYCFSHSDEFITYSNNKIYLYDTLSQSKKDSAEIEGINANISLKHSFKNNKVLFFAGNKFGIFESDYFENNDNPKISYDSTHVYVGQPIKFYLLNKNEYEKIEWYYSKGLIGEGKNPTFTFDEPGIESITIKLTRNGNLTEKTFEGLLEILPQLKADFSSDISEGIAPLTVHFTNNSSGNITSYKWDFWDSFGHNYTSTEENPNITFEYDGYYNVRLIISDEYSKNTVNKTLFIQVNKTKINVIKNLKYFTVFGGSYHIRNSNEYVRLSINSPGAVIFNDNIYIFYTKEESFDVLSSSFLKLDNNMREIEGYILSNMLLNDKFTEFESIGNNELILSGNGKYGRNWFVTKFNDDLSKNLSFHIGFTQNEYNTYFNVNLSNIQHCFAFSNNKHSLFLKFDSELKLTVNDTVYTKLYGFTKYSDKMIALIHKPLNSKNFYLKYLNQNLEETGEFNVDDLQNTNIKYILTLPNKHIAFCGFNTIDSLGVIGSINPEGRIDWIKKFSNWKSFKRLLINGNAIYAIGESECFVGFLEFDMKGEKFSHNGFYDRGITNTIDLDFINQDSVLLTYKIIDYNYICLAMCQFKPLDIKDIQDTTKGIISPKIKVSPNPAYNEVKFEFDEELTVKSIEIYNTDGVLVEIINYVGINGKEIVVNIKKYSIGIYFVKIHTEKGISNAKFIKY